MATKTGRLKPLNFIDLGFKPGQKLTGKKGTVCEGISAIVVGPKHVVQFCTKGKPEVESLSALTQRANGKKVARPAVLWSVGRKCLSDIHKASAQ